MVDPNQDKIQSLLRQSRQLELVTKAAIQNVATISTALDTSNFGKVIHEHFRMNEPIAASITSLGAFL